MKPESNTSFHNASAFCLLNFLKKSALYLVLAILFGSSSAFATDDPSYKLSLESIQNKVPLTYNEPVRNYINILIAQKKRMGMMLGLSKYYFPIYEKVFKERNVPEELKYLSVIESSLNPNAVSHAEAAGPWQFLNEVGKKYGLAVNDSIDERRDPMLACNAAASYLLDSYNMYHDWLLVIASYNCGHNNIRWAIEDAGGKTDYWSIRKYLPAETQNYVPAFIATVYIMNYASRHGIYPIEPDFNTETEVIQVQTKISLDEIANRGNIIPGYLYLLNPAYKKGFINGSAKSPKSLVVPVLPTYKYNALCQILGAPLRVITAQTTVVQAPVAKVNYLLSYTIQPGDTLASIAAKFNGATPQSIKEVNKLTDADVLTPGKVISILQ